MVLVAKANVFVKDGNYVKCEGKYEDRIIDHTFSKKMLMSLVISEFFKGNEKVNNYIFDRRSYLITCYKQF